MRPARALALGAVLAGLAVAGCGTAAPSRPHATFHPYTESMGTPPSPAPITSEQERFIDAIRAKFASITKGSTNITLATFERNACQYIAGGTMSIAEQEAQANWAADWATAPPSPRIITELVTLAGEHGCPAALASAKRFAAKQARQERAAKREARQDAAQQAAARRLAHSVTYIVTGSGADVTYGPAGSDYQGSVPMNVSMHLGSPMYYAISAQLQGGGSVTCKILVAGHVISKAHASGGYNIAMCEITQDLYGGWVSTNG